MSIPVSEFVLQGTMRSRLHHACVDARGHTGCPDGEILLSLHKMSSGTFVVSVSVSSLIYCVHAA